MSNQRLIAAVDLGSSKTATAIAEVSDTRGIYILSLSSVPTEGMAKGVVRDLKGVGMSVYQSFSQAAHTVGDAPESVYLSISGALIESFNAKVTMKLGLDSEEVTDETIELLHDLAKNHSAKQGHILVDAVPQMFDLDDIKAIRNPVGMFGHEIALNFHAITGQESHIRNLKRSVERTDLSISGFILSVLGSAFAVIKEEESRGGVLVIDIGGGTTDIAILIDGCLQFSAVIPVGGFHLDNDLCQGLGISLEEAIRLKHNYGRIRGDTDDEVVGEFVDIKRIGKRDYEKIPKIEIYKILEPRIEEILDLINSTLRSTSFFEYIAGGAVLVGGSANIRGFKNALTRKLNVPVRVGYPEGFTHLLGEHRTPSYATVLGMLRYISQLPEPKVEPSGFVRLMMSGKEYLKDFIAALASAIMGKSGSTRGVNSDRDEDRSDA